MKSLTDWFKKLFSLKRKQSIFHDVICRLEEFQPESQADSFSSDKTLDRILVAYSDVDEYIKSLKQLIPEMEVDNIVAKSYAAIQPTVVYKRDFYTRQGSYVDPVESSKELIELCLKFVKLYQDKMNETEPSFNTSKNLLYLQKLVSNISTLSKELSM